MSARLLLVALAFLIATLALGWFVTSRPPGTLDHAAVALRGRGVAAAFAFTTLGRWYAVVVVGAVAFGIAITLRTGILAVTILLVAQVLSQTTAALLKLGFSRPRPMDFLGMPESDLSFPSGHAVTAIVLFGGLAIVAWHAPLPRPVGLAVCVLLAVCVIGIPWSRLALGVHYATDVIGGTLLGIAWLSAAFAVIVRTAVTTPR